MPALATLLLCLLSSSAGAFSVGSVLQPWLAGQASELGLLKSATAAAKAQSLFASAPLARWDQARARLQALGAPQRLPGGLESGYQLRKGLLFAKSQAYLLHYQEGEPETDAHWFQLARRLPDGSWQTLQEFGTCIGEVRRVRLSPKGPQFILLTESTCGRRATFRLLRADQGEPQGAALALPSMNGDLRSADLDRDGVQELIHVSLSEPPAALRMRLDLASDYKPALHGVLRRSQAWRWDGQAWAKAGLRWSQP